MRTDESDSMQSRSKRRLKRQTPVPALTANIGSSSVDDQFERLHEMIQGIVSREISALRETLEVMLKSNVPSEPQAKGSHITPGDRGKAKDLRTALLIGKIPESAGLLIDVKTAASLLNVSPRTLFRLNDLQAIPEPVRFGRLVRWQLTEILEWLDAGCPSRKHWSASKSVSQKPSRR